MKIIVVVACIYRQFRDDDQHSSAILPEIELEEIDRVEIRPVSRTSRFRHYLTRRTRLELILIISLIVLFISLIIVVIQKPSNQSISLCLTGPCLDLSSSILSSMNQSVDPCDDFHQFVCGRWIRTHLIPKGHPSWSMMKILSEKNLIVLKSLFEQNLSETTSNRPEDQVKRFYRSCLNLTESDRLKETPLEEFFRENFNWTLEQWKNLERNQSQIDLFLRISTFLNIRYGISTIFPIEISADEKNSSWNTIHINQPQLILNSRDYYVNSTTNEKNVLIREKYVEVGANLLQLIGFEKTQSIERMNDILQLEIKLAEISLPMEILQRPTETYALISFDELESQYKRIGFNVKMFFNDLFNTYRSDRIEMNSNDPIVVLSLGLMTNLSSIVQSYLLTPGKSHVLLDHLLLSFIFEFSSQLSSIFDETILPLKKVLLGTNALPDRWEFCVKQTDTAFSYVTGSMYVDAVFGQTDKNQAKQLIKNLRNIFRENLDELSWIDGPTRQHAIEKLEKIEEKIAYPDLIRNRTELIRRYENYSMTENEYFRNTLQIYHHERRRILRRFRRSVDRNEWSMTPRTVNAYYSPSLNEIVFPAGILQPPFFHKDLPLTINYGSIGSIIGHEMTHGFDNQGREFDADGNLRSWWTNQSVEKYKDKSQCFIEQYSNYSIDGVRTLGENIADNGGMKIAFRAYRKHEKQRNVQLPGLNYTSDQLFFIAFAHGWCSVETEEAKSFNLISDPHASTRFRILGTVMNSEEFSSSFSCPKTSRMNPTRKCQLW